MTWANRDLPAGLLGSPTSNHHSPASRRKFANALTGKGVAMFTGGPTYLALDYKCNGCGELTLPGMAGTGAPFTGCDSLCPDCAPDQYEALK